MGYKVISKPPSHHNSSHRPYREKNMEYCVSYNVRSETNRAFNMWYFIPTVKHGGDRRHQQRSRGS